LPMLKKITSFGSLLREILRVARRFPLSTLAALFAAAVAEFSVSARWPWLITLSAVGILAVPAYAAAETSAERYSAGFRARAAAFLAVLLALYSLYFSHTVSGEMVFFMRWVQLLAAGAAALVVLPFVRAGTARQCWWRSAHMFEGAAVGWFTAVVVFAGLAAALSLFRYLFDIDLGGTLYLRIWIGCSLLLGPLIFLAFIPRNAAEVETFPYPPRLEKLLRFVFIPLVLAYMLLLYAYIFKLGIVHAWPKGTLGYLIAGVSGLGVMTWLALYPVKDTVDGYPRWYARGFFQALLPLLVLLLLALWRRIAEYGITERRYFLGVYGLWMCGLAVYFAVSKKKDPRWIPGTFLVLALATAAGPWGAYAVSVRSQVARLQKGLAEQGLLKDGKVVPGLKTLIPAAEYWSIISAVGFLVTRNETARLQPWTAESLEGKNFSEVREALGLDTVTSAAPARLPQRDYFAVRKDLKAAQFLEVKDYDFAWYFTNNMNATVAVGGEQLVLKSRLSGHTLEVFVPGSIIRVDLKKIVKASISGLDRFEYQAPEGLMRADAAAGKIEYRLVLDYLHGYVLGNYVEVQNINGFLLIKKPVR